MRAGSAEAMGGSGYYRVAGGAVAVAAAVVSGLGLAALWGWHTGTMWLLRIQPHLAPLPYNSALAFLLCGAALLALLMNRRLWALPSASLAALLGVLTLVQHAFEVELGIDRLFMRQADPSSPLPGPIPPNAAFCFLLAGVSLAVQSIWPRWRRGSLVAVAAGSVVLALGAVALAGHVVGITTYGWWPVMTRMAAHGSVGFTVLGAGLVASGWREEQAAGGGWPRWLPLPVGLCALTATLCLWQALGAYQREHLEHLTRLTVIMADDERESATREELLREHVEVLPEVTLGAGVALAALLTLAVHLALEGHRRAQAAEQAHHLTQTAIYARQQAEQELDQFFNLTAEMLAIAGTDGYLKRVNPAFERTLGYTARELTSVPFADFIHSDDREATLREVEQLSRGAVPLDFENRYRTHDGSYRWLRWSAAPEPGLGLLFCTAQDVTELKRSEEALRQAHEELEERVRERTEELESFTYSVSHDLRAPLRHIDGFSKLLFEQAGAQLEGASRRWLERIREGTQQMAQMVDDLLNLSRAGRQEPNRRPTNLCALIQSALADLGSEQAGRQLAIRVGDLPEVECDPALIKQVFVNLLSNALKFTRPRPQALIEVGSGERNGQLVFWVRDNGVGFEMKYADKLFGVFQRLHRKEEFDGAGVGLATVQRIIHKHGGEIWAEAEPDRGATFFFTLGERASRPPGDEYATVRSGDPAGRG